MNDKLKTVIKTIRLELNNDPDGIIIGKIRNGNTEQSDNSNPKIQSYFDFLKECNGVRCGSIDIFGADIIQDYQFMVNNIPGGNDKWLYIGQILYEPVVINKIDSKVYRFFRGNEDINTADCLGLFDEFLLNYVFGDKYAEIVPDAEDDEWYRFLKKIKVEKCEKIYNNKIE
ncbi:MAG: hypothetical protein E7510_06920 [Ruminococcus sp.]|nr:hypothetical protein [Ruminococcus sp.]